MHELLTMLTSSSMWFLSSGSEVVTTSNHLLGNLDKPGYEDRTIIATTRQQEINLRRLPRQIPKNHPRSRPRL
jgi:hypothetical protein